MSDRPDRSSHPAASAPDNLIENPLDRAKRTHEKDRPQDRPQTTERPHDPGDKLITNPLDKPGAPDNLITNPLDKR